MGGKIGGVYSADGHIVVQEGRGNHHANRSGRNSGHGLFDQYLHQSHHHHHKKQSNQQRRGTHDCGGNGRGFGKTYENHWAEKRNELRSQLRRQELIPRARLRQRSPEYRTAPPPQRPVRHSVSCCGKRINKPDIERTRSDTGYYARPVYIEEKRRSDIERRYVKYERSTPDSEEFGYCTLKRTEARKKREEESDMEYYTACSDTQEPEVKKTNESNESGFDERRDSTSSEFDKVDPIYEVVKKDKKEEIKIESNIPVPPTMPPLPEKDKNDNIKSVHNTISEHEMRKEIRKFIEKKENNARLYDSVQNVNSQFYEEEFSYEPELKKTSSKLVLRTRSLLNLDEENTINNKTYVVRPPAVRTKITTGPDGTFVIAGRKATSELNLSDDSTNSSPKARSSGEDLQKIKEAIFRPKTEEKPNKNRFNEEINKDNTQTTKQKAIDNLKKYLKENKIGLRELLTNKNVVIIEPYREEKPVDISEYNHRNSEFDKGCRITGATVKSGSIGDLSNTLPRASKPHQPNVQRHYFYHLIKTKADLKDDELPDPDKVRSTRQMFQKEVKISGPEDTEIMLPIAAKIVNPSKDSKPRLTPEVRVIYDGKKIDKKPKKWTDTGSLSSGVSSDMSCFENEDNNLDEISHKGYSSDDELEAETFRPEIHPVSPEVMKKIRDCGTTVTYYGGRVISHSHGPVRSPMTMTIMDEIRQGHENSKKSQYMGVKFRLVKSNSCGSRLELAGTDEQEPSKNRYYEEMYGKSLSEELAECRSRMEPIQDVEDDKINQDQEDVKPPQSWRALIESRKQLKANRRNCPDMVFEEYQIAEN